MRYRPKGQLVLQTCLLGSNASGRNHGVISETAACKITAEERSTLNQYCMTVFATFQREANIKVPCQFMVMLPLGSEAKSRWALIHSNVDERTATGIRVIALAAILSEDELCLGYDNLLSIERALMAELPGINRTKPPAVEITLEDDAYHLPLNVVRSVSIRREKPLRFFVVGEGLPISKLAFEVFDARAALQLPRMAVSSIPALLVSADWNIRTNLTIQVEASGGKPAKNAIAIDEDHNVSEFSLDEPQQLWCEFCQAMALRHMQWPHEQNATENSSFQQNFAKVLWDLRAYEGNSAFDVLSFFADRSEYSHGLLHMAVKQNVDWAFRPENRDRFDMIVLPMIFACLENERSEKACTQFESIIMERMGKPLLAGLFNEPVNGAVLNLMFRNYNFLAANATQTQTNRGHVID